MFKNAVFIAGHTPERKGVKAYTGLWEHDFNKAICWQLATLDNVTIAHRYYENYQNYVLSLLDYIPRDSLVIELHLNSSTIDVQGCEALTSGRDFKINTVADILCQSFSKEFGVRNRGVKQPIERGKYFVEKVPNSIIWEAFFCHHKDKTSELFLQEPDKGVALMVSFWKRILGEILNG